ncbi:MAG: GNAT family N-acetyltransferase [Candidatus Eremiobacteraeota bacterium]|nr:GNAT family N-acetyltransferase [Candidatus Eremiobacteraeota bacterium]
MRLDCGVCVVRSYRHDDDQALVKHANNPNVSRYLRDSFPYPYTISDARSWLRYAVDIDHEETHFAIERDREAIGGLGFTRFAGERQFTAEFGYWLGEGFWGQGITTAAVAAFVDWLWRETDLQRIQSGVFEPNVASRRVLEKCGFTYESTLRRAAFKHGRFFDTQLFVKLRPR